MKVMRKCTKGKVKGGNDGAGKLKKKNQKNIRKKIMVTRVMCM